MECAAACPPGPGAEAVAFASAGTCCAKATDEINSDTDAKSKERIIGSLA